MTTREWHAAGMPAAGTPSRHDDDDEEEEEEEGAARAPEVALDGKLEGEAADTNALDLNQTERYEVQGLSMDQKEAGGAMEAFNMDGERREGHFDVRAARLEPPAGLPPSRQTTCRSARSGVRRLCVRIPAAAGRLQLRVETQGRGP
jgi:hypothetical protein